MEGSDRVAKLTGEQKRNLQKGQAKGAAALLRKPRIRKALEKEGWEIKMPPRKKE